MCVCVRVRVCVCACVRVLIGGVRERLKCVGNWLCTYIFKDASTHSDHTDTDTTPTSARTYTPLHTPYLPPPRPSYLKRLCACVYLDDPHLRSCTFSSARMKTRTGLLELPYQVDRGHTHRGHTHNIQQYKSYLPSREYARYAVAFLQCNTTYLYTNTHTQTQTQTHRAAHVLQQSVIFFTFSLLARVLQTWIRSSYLLLGGLPGHQTRCFERAYRIFAKSCREASSRSDIVKYSQTLWMKSLGDAPRKEKRPVVKFANSKKKSS